MATRKKSTGRSADASAGAAAAKRKAAMAGRKAVNSTKAKVAKTASDAVSRKYTYEPKSGGSYLTNNVSGITRNTTLDNKPKTRVTYYPTNAAIDYSSKVQKKLKKKFD